MGDGEISNLSRDPQYYISNFYDFLCKRIKEPAGEDS